MSDEETIFKELNDVALAEKSLKRKYDADIQGSSTPPDDGKRVKK